MSEQNLSPAKTIRDRLEALRKRMKAAGGDICLITDNDPHISEYTGDHYKIREFFSGFTGSAGTLVVGLDSAWLFTDGRYFVQAEKELEGTGIELMKSGVGDTPTPSKFISRQAALIRENKNRRAKVLCDGTLIPASDGLFLCGDKNVELNSDFKPEENIWQNRPDKPFGAIFILDEKYAGESAASKIGRIKEKMKETGADVHISASLEDISWTLNLRGSDIECTPVFESFLLIKEKAVLFAHQESLSENVVKYLSEQCVDIENYDTLYNYIKTPEITEGKKILADKRNINFNIISCIAGNENAEDVLREKFIFAPSPESLMRAVKNETEIGHITEAHKDDGLCVTRLMYYVKSEVNEGRQITETDVADFIDKLRQQVSDFVTLSFPTISAYGANAAMMHYSAERETAAVLETKGMLLVDSGGHYLRGTTDVTRTFALGEVSAEEKKAYTLVLKGVLALADARFLGGTSGYGLDILARQFLWREGIDYRSGTGHGVGYMLSVHEGPNAFRYKYHPGVSDYCELTPGMITTDEPGVYEEGRFGIRIENELLCEKDFENEYGTFLKFKNLTLVPYDKDLIAAELLEEKEIVLINDYHRLVLETHSPFLEGEELEFLRQYTSPIGEKSKE